MGERHTPPKYVVKAIKEIIRYCDDIHKRCSLCPYTNNNCCIFSLSPHDNETWKIWADEQEEALTAEMNRILKKEVEK